MKSSQFRPMIAAVSCSENLTDTRPRSNFGKSRLSRNHSDSLLGASNNVRMGLQDTLVPA